MSILDHKFLPKHGPYIQFARLPTRLPISDDEWPATELYREYVFFEFSDCLAEALCSLTRSYLFFSPHDFSQFSSSHTIYDVAGQMLSMANRVAICPEFYFARQLSLYDGSLAFQECRTTNHLKSDILETLLFLCEKIREIANQERCLGIIGI